MFPTRSRAAPLSAHAVAEWVDHWQSKLPDGAFGDLQAAVRAAAKDYVAVHEAHGRIGSDRTLTEGGRLVRQAKFARAKMTTAMDRLTKAQTKHAELRAQLDAKLVAVFDFSKRPHAEVQDAREIREHLKGLPIDQRMLLITAAMKENDVATLTAIGSGKDFLSGVPRSLHGHIRDHVLHVVEPMAVVQRGLMIDAEQFTQQFAETLLQSTADLIDFDTAESFERTATETAA